MTGESAQRCAYYRARHFSPTAQRFLNEDPQLTPLTRFTAATCPILSDTIWKLPNMISQPGRFDIPGRLNGYAYVLNNPVQFTDPSGLDKDDNPCKKDQEKCFLDAYNRATNYYQQRCIIDTLGPACPKPKR
jgi:hypothetical protein